jgi:hypothetical protein
MRGQYREKETSDTRFVEFRVDPEKSLHAVMPWSSSLFRKIPFFPFEFLLIASHLERKREIQKYKKTQNKERDHGITAYR